MAFDDAWHGDGSSVADTLGAEMPEGSFPHSDEPVSTTAGASPSRVHHEVAPLYLLDVQVSRGARTQAHGVLWDGVLNATVDDDVDGPSPIEALMAALAGCVARNLGSVVEHAHLALDGMEMRIAAERTDDPPALTSLRLDLDVQTDAPPDHIARLISLALRSGTITNSLARAVPLDVHASLNGEPLELIDEPPAGDLDGEPAGVPEDPVAQDLAHSHSTDR